MRRQSGGVLIVGVALLVGLVPGCAAPIPREEVPAGWALDVHQPGEWWTQPLIPRSVVVQRCPPSPGWASEPDLTRVHALPPGTDIEYSALLDDDHCMIGWSEPAQELTFSPDEMTTEAGLRRICSSTGLPMDASWRFLGDRVTERVGEMPEAADGSTSTWETTTAAFTDAHATVVACLVDHLGEAGGIAVVELAVGTDRVDAAAPTEQACPVTPRGLARGEDGTLEYYELRGAGAVRGDDGRVLTEAASLRIGLAGDRATTSHPVVDGVAIVDARVTPAAAVSFEWDRPPEVEGQVLAADGSILATCLS